MVNVNDFSADLPEGDLLEAIFEKQKSLMDKYDKIEENNLGYSIPHGIFNCDDPKAQQRFKDFAWRVTEELAEATECYEQEDKTHFLEESIDALHFFVELLIHAGFEPQHLVPLATGDRWRWIFDVVGQENGACEDVYLMAYKVIETIGRAMNCLKNKPWKQTHMQTDRVAFRMLLMEAFNHFVVFLVSAGFKAETSTLMYLNKNAVNQFRIRSAY